MQLFWNCFWISDNALTITVSKHARHNNKKAFYHQGTLTRKSCLSCLFCPVSCVLSVQISVKYCSNIIHFCSVKMINTKLRFLVDFWPNPFHRLQGNATIHPHFHYAYSARHANVNVFVWIWMIGLTLG